MTAAEQAETIVLLHLLTGMSIVDCAYAVIPKFDETDFMQTAALTISLRDAQKKLEAEQKDAHS